MTDLNNDERKTTQPHFYPTLLNPYRDKINYTVTINNNQKEERKKSTNSQSYIKKRLLSIVTMNYTHPKSDWILPHLTPTVLEDPSNYESHGFYPSKYLKLNTRGLALRYYQQVLKKQIMQCTLLAFFPPAPEETFVTKAPTTRTKQHVSMTKYNFHINHYGSKLFNFPKDMFYVRHYNTSPYGILPSKPVSVYKSVLVDNKMLSIRQYATPKDVVRALLRNIQDPTISNRETKVTNLLRASKTPSTKTNLDSIKATCSDAPKILKTRKIKVNNIKLKTSKFRIHRSIFNAVTNFYIRKKCEKKFPSVPQYSKIKIRSAISDQYYTPKKCASHLDIIKFLCRNLRDQSPATKEVMNFLKAFQQHHQQIRSSSPISSPSYVTTSVASKKVKLIATNVHYKLARNPKFRNGRLFCHRVTNFSFRRKTSLQQLKRNSKNYSTTNSPSFPPPLQELKVDYINNSPANLQYDLKANADAANFQKSHCNSNIQHSPDLDRIREIVEPFFQSEFPCKLRKYKCNYLSLRRHSAITALSYHCRIALKLRLHEELLSIAPQRNQQKQLPIRQSTTESPNNLPNKQYNVENDYNKQRLNLSIASPPQRNSFTTHHGTSDCNTCATTDETVETNEIETEEIEIVFETDNSPPENVFDSAFSVYPDLSPFAGAPHVHPFTYRPHGTSVRIACATSEIFNPTLHYNNLYFNPRPNRHINNSTTSPERQAAREAKQIVVSPPHTTTTGLIAVAIQRTFSPSESSVIRPTMIAIMPRITNQFSTALSSSEQADSLSIASFSSFRSPTNAVRKKQKNQHEKHTSTARNKLHSKSNAPVTITDMNTVNSIKNHCKTQSTAKVSMSFDLPRFNSRRCSKNGKREKKFLLHTYLHVARVHSKFKAQLIVTYAQPVPRIYAKISFRPFKAANNSTSTYLLPAKSHLVRTHTRFKRPSIRGLTSLNAQPPSEREPD